MTQSRHARHSLPRLSWVLVSLLPLLLLLPFVVAQDNQAPAPAFDYAPATVVALEPILFTSHSTDDGSIVNWTWSFGDGTFAYGEQVEHRFSRAGDFVVQLTVTDDEGLANLLGKTVRVAPAPQKLSALPPWLFWAMPLLVSGILLSLAYIVLQRGQPVIYNLVFFLLYLVSGLKSLMESFAVLTHQAAGGMHGAFLEAAESLSYLFGPLFLWFVLVFPRPVHPWLIEGRRGAVTLLLAVPFLLNQFFGWIPFDATVNYFNGFVSVLALSCLGILVYHAWETDSEEERSRIRFLSVTFGILVVSAIVLALLNVAYTYYAASGNPGAAAAILRTIAIFGLVIAPLFEIVGAMVMLYAILRYQLMGVQTLVVKMTRGAAVALMVPAIFIIVGNVIEEIFQSVVLEGVRFDFIIAGFVSAFAMAPVQKFTTFLLNKFLPALTAADEAKRRIEIFETQLRYSLLDGALNEKETQILRVLAQEIKMQPPELAQVVRSFPYADLRALLPPSSA